MTYTREYAETTAVQVVNWLVGNEELLRVFLGSTGAAQADIKEGLTDSAFLGGVLDFVMLDDAWVVSCCDDLQLPYNSLMAARQALPGGIEEHWT